MAIDHDFRVGREGNTPDACRVVRELGVTVVYLADRPVWEPGYRALRKAGVRGIVVHDHTSGVRTRPEGLRRLLKRARALVPGTTADRVIAVSDFVARRKVEVDLVPVARVTRIWNSIDVEGSEAVDSPHHDAGVRAELGIAQGRPVVLVACRATEHKGVHHVLSAFDSLAHDPSLCGARPVLVYAGDGPALDGLRALRERLHRPEDVYLLGYRTDVPQLIDAADVCVVPSVWAEAFGLSALEPMLHERPVIATATGGLPEVVVDGKTGLLVPPGDETSLRNALATLLADDAMRRRMGKAGRLRVLDRFERGAQLDRLTEVILGQVPSGTLEP